MRRISLIRSGGRCALVAFSLREQCPCATGGLVGDGDGDNPSRLALQERSDQSARSGFGGWCPPCDGGGTDNQQPTQVVVPYLQYMPEQVLAPGRVLSGHKAKVGCKLPPSCFASKVGRSITRRSSACGAKKACNSRGGTRSGSGCTTRTVRSSGSDRNIPIISGALILFTTS